MKRTVIFSIDAILWALAAWLNSGYMQMRLPAEGLALLMSVQAVVSGWLLSGERLTGRGAVWGALSGLSALLACAAAWALPEIYLPQGTIMALEKQELLLTALGGAVCVASVCAQRGAWGRKAVALIGFAVLLATGCVFLRIREPFGQNQSALARLSVLPLLLALNTAIAAPQSAPRSSRARAAYGVTSLLLLGYAGWMLAALTQFALGMFKGSISPRYSPMWIWGVRQALPLTAMFAGSLLAVRAVQPKRA